jgi:hypothetical protein
LKSSRNRAFLATGAAVAITCSLAAHARLPEWMQSVVSGSSIESALYRAMDLPGIRTLYTRPPAEARDQLTKLVAAKPDAAQLYALRAQVDEQALDFNAAEQDWKLFAAHAQNKTQALFQLADYYHRRNLGPQEIATLESAAAAPSPASEQFLSADRQQAWQAFPRALAIAHDQALGDDATIAIYQAWIARYPTEPAARANFIAALLAMHRYTDAQHAIEAYHAAFPNDTVLPIKAAALLALDENTPDATQHALALFDTAYQPLWPDDLIKTYFELLDATHTAHTMLATARAQLLHKPDHLTAATKLFNYYQQQGHQDAAIDTITQYEAGKDARHASWSSDELYTFATLLERDAQPQQAARFYLALSSAQGPLSATPQSPAEAGLCGLIRLLLTSPAQPIAIGSGNLSIYRDIATLDPGPGYLNGILSLWLNSQSPAAEFQSEEQKATPYFHRAKAAELLTLLDQHFPASAARPALHAQLIQAYIAYGQDDAVKQSAQRFLTEFPTAPQHLQVALELADADARTNDTQAEFALYDKLLTELAAQLKGMPLTASGPVSTNEAPPSYGDDSNPPAATPTPAALLQQSLTLSVAPPPTTNAAEAYRQVLDRYLGRLTTTGQIPAALLVLRRELDRNPNDTLLYERLAEFLQQNNLAEQEEAVYRQALARFNDTTFYDKLARFYIRHQRDQDFDTLSRKVVDIFRGTELENYFTAAGSSHPNDPLWPREYLELNLYAHQRFPHDLAFTRNLLFAYEQPGTADPKAYDLLLRKHFQEASDLQTEFFEDLASHHQLDAELASLKALIPTSTTQQQDPAATHELAELYLWQSHFEQSAPLLGELAQSYPANIDIGDQAASVYRSLAYFDPAEIPHAVAIEQHLSAADPANLDRLATIGDIYANSTDTSLNLNTAQQLHQARPFWLQMASVHAGLPDGYLQSATVFWDYFQFDDALAQIEAARKHFQNPALYGYQAGAIYESKRDYPRAIAEYIAASISNDPPNADGNDDASARLLTLASRPEFASLVDQATAKVVASNPSIPALTLRLNILTALHQKSNIAPLVASAIARAQSVAQLTALEDFSQSHQLPTTYQAALRRQIALTTDPIQRIEFQYQLVRSLVDAKDIAAAQTIIDSVHTANPELVGVVRTTTDFYWNNKQPQRAIATLLQAAHQANPTLAHDFTLEAIAKSNQSGDYTGARTLLQPLLAADPFNPQYLSLEAESYSLAHDNAGVRDLYTNILTALKTAPLGASDRRNKIALARQGLIPALTGLNDFAGAMNQHIALISAFPEDDSILQNAVAYARLHGREAQLVAFLNQAVAASPRDSRFAIDLGQVDVLFDDPTGALAAYSKAIAIRSDRADLYIARADLEERSQSFDAACADYERLYKLTYNDPQWLEKVAELRARQGNPDLAAKALQTAWIDGRPASAQNEFLVAQKLEAWNLLPQANTYAQQGVQLAGNDLLTNADNSDGAILYARLLARQRKSPEAFDFLKRILAASNTSPSSPSVVLQQVEKQGLTSITDSDWRNALVAARLAQAQSTYRNAVQAIASVVAEFYTPEEKSAFATLLNTQRANSSNEDLVHLWIPAAKTAHLEDREAAWKRDILLHGGKLASSQLESFCTLETARMDNRTLAESLDTYAQQLPVERQSNILTRAVTAWHNAEDTQYEAIDLRELAIDHQQQYYEQRLFDLYLHGDSNALLELTKQSAPLGDNAANYVLANATQSQSYQALANRTASRTPVWNTANTALLGLYYNDLSAKTDTAFQSTLGDLTIGPTLANKPDATKQLVGQPWFYYATRYGFFLTLTPHPAHNPEDYLAAVLEQAPTDPASYKALAQTYLDAHQLDAAILEYRHAIEVDPADAGPNIAIAEALWNNQHQDQALTEWNAALTKLLARVNQRDVPESFWTNFAVLANDAATNHLGPQLKPAMTLVLTAYIRKNGTYRSTELLHSAYDALAKPNPAEATNWLLSLIAAAPASDDRLTMISSLTDATWLPHEQWGAIYRTEISLAQIQQQANPSAASAYTTEYGFDQLTNYKSQYIQWLLDRNQAAEAQAVFDSLSPAQRNTTDLQPDAILLAAKQSRIPALLASYQNNPAQAPDLTVLSSTASTLQQQHDLANSRLLLEYVFQQKLEQQTLTAPDYLSLAEVRIDTNDLPDALNLLHRLTLRGDFYDNLDSAAALLERTNHLVEALPLLTTLTHGTPWNTQYQLRLAKAQLALQQTAPAATALTTIAANDQSPYATRAAAAIALHTVSSTSHFSSEELTLVATTTPTPQQADQPYFLYARIAALTNVPATQRVALLRAAIATAPPSMLDWLRFHLFQTELTLGRDTQASVAIDPVLTNNSALFLNTSTNNPPTDPYDLASVFSTDSDKRTFLLSVASMDEHLNDQQQAIEHLQSAKQLTTNPTEIAALTQRIYTLQAAIDLAQQNALRRPTLQPSVDQPNIVRPRLIAGATTEVNP